MPVGQLKFLKAGKSIATRRWAIPMLGVCLCAGAAMAASPRTFATPQELLRAMITEEQDSAAKHERYEYLSKERSERTGGHVWTERVVETGQGKVRLLLEVDGVPVSAEKTEQERGRLAGILANPEEFSRTEEARMGDEAKSRRMLDDLDRGFILDNVELVDGVWHLNYHPNPNFSPSGIEERVLHGMSGWLAIDAKDLRLVHIEGRLPVDVSIGFGLLATIHAGSHFASDREFIDGHWRTTHVVTDIRGKAVLFKSVAKDSDLTRSDFHYLDPNITLTQAVALVEQ
jgi:hypothetical protein